MLVSPAERLRRLADDGDGDSLSRRLRERRFQMFDSLVERLPHPISILDVGGTVEFWERRGWADRPGVSITLAEPRRAGAAAAATCTPVVGDATDLQRASPTASSTWRSATP